ncbi:Crossover junction endonuclease mus81 [Arthrobotrys musiformis]|uniref:Crossover junction endonuclease MUS81 n=1 Tax=Arthrobotrys musiformis TaxID=47236 RepID=A0AAV9WLX4_9PEZI
MPPKPRQGLPCGNPVLLQFLLQWAEDARGTDRERTYRRAADSMRACPRAFDHPSEAKNLIGIGDKIADRLTKSYIDYKEDRGETPPPLVPYMKPQKTSKKRKSAELEDIIGEGSDVSETGRATGIAGEDMGSLFDSGEPVLGRWDRARPPKKKKAAASRTAQVDLDGDEDGAEGPEPVKRARRPRTTKQYIPRARSGGWAILMALSELEYSESIGKDELCRRAQPYCDSSFTLAGNPGSTHKYTAWASMKTIKEHNYVSQRGRPALFCLTDHGWDAADAMRDVTDQIGVPQAGASTVVTTGGGGRKGKAKERVLSDHTIDRSLASAVAAGNAFAGQEHRLGGAPTNLDEDEDEDVVGAFPPVTNDPQSIVQTIRPRQRMRSASAQPTNNAPPDVKTPFIPRYLKAGSFTVQLVLDNREVAAKTDRDYLQRSFENAGCSPITRGMELGDVMWVARGKLFENGRETDEEVELSLDYVCERKRLDDLVSSIKDGRFREQKFRLKRFVGNVTYIIELPNGKIAANTPQMADAITTAIYSTQVSNGFFVKLSPRLDDTVRYLARFTRLLKQLYEGKDLYMYPENLVQISTFDDLKAHLKEKEPDREYCLSYGCLAAMSNKSKTFTIRDVFLKMLMCTRGISAEKALEIQRHFKTPRQLLERYDRAGSEIVGKPMMMTVVDVATRVDRRKIKRALSEKVWDVWGKK